MTVSENFSGIRPAEGQPAGYEIIANKIVELIKSGDLKPGDRLPAERALGEQLGVSRTVIREAVKMLSAIGIIRVLKGSGLYVSSKPHYPFTAAAIDIEMTIEPGDIERLFEFRMTIELQTARLAAERIVPRELRALQEVVTLYEQSTGAHQLLQFHENDIAFHIGIAQATSNPFLVSAVKTIHRLQDWATQIVMGSPPGSRIMAVEQHCAILAAIRDGQPEQAALAMQTHIETVLSSYQQEVRRRLRGDGSESPV